MQIRQCGRQTYLGELRAISPSVVQAVGEGRRHPDVIAGERHRSEPAGTVRIVASVRSTAEARLLGLAASTGVPPA